MAPTERHCPGLLSLEWLRWQIESRNCRFHYFPHIVDEMKHKLSYVRFFGSFQTKHSLSVFKIIKNDPSSYPYPWPHSHGFFFFNHRVSYIKHFKWGDCYSELTSSMLAIPPDPPSKSWMHSKLIKWVTAFGRGQSQLVLVNCIPSNWQTINGVFFFFFSQGDKSAVGDWWLDIMLFRLE